ncbi:MAG: hypothetical protein HYS09_05085 [Chloroflexi bacterium]|nr:hypothetical protein [Chloroflexota bacterium]
MTRGIRWWRFIGIWGFLALLAFAGGVGRWGGESHAADYRVKVFYFHPNDYQPETAYIDQIDPSVETVQQWFGSQVGRTFVVSPVVVVRGDHDSGWYKCSPQRCDGLAVWFNVLTELRDRGYADYCQDHAVMVFVASAISFNGGAACGEPYTAQVGGISMNPETVFDPMLGRCDPSHWSCDPDVQRGLIAHELGHALTLPHPKDCGVSYPDYCQQTVMWGWTGFPNVGLLDLEFAPEKQTLAGSPFFAQADGGSPSGDTSTADTTPPTVQILSPIDGSAIVGRFLTIQAAAIDNVAVAKIALYIDSKLVYSGSGATVDYKWMTNRKVVQGAHNITVMALDGHGNSGSTSVTVYK